LRLNDDESALEEFSSTLLMI